MNRLSKFLALLAATALVTAAAPDASYAGSKGHKSSGSSHPSHNSQSPGFAEPSHNSAPSGSSQPSHNSAPSGSGQPSHSSTASNPNAGSHSSQPSTSMGSNSSPAKPDPVTASHAGNSNTTPSSQAGGTKPKLVRQDNFPYSPQGKASDRKKSHIDQNGDLQPANPNGSATITQHVRGSEPKKSDSPFTSFSQGPGGKDYGGHKIEVDHEGLANGIAAGEHPGTEIISHDQVMKAHNDRIAAAQEKYKNNPSKNNKESLDRAMADSKNSRRDQEVLIRGPIPKKYITVHPPNAQGTNQ